MSLAALSLSDAAAEIRAGRITSAELVADCLKRVEELEAKVQAWAFLDPDHAMKQARAADEHRRHGRDTGPLHGVPVGIKDVLDTTDMPTEFGSPYWAGRTPRDDAAAVARLRAAGAVIMGKTVTTEYAFMHPGKTTNPHDVSRTPGGSSSGSAAAVAAHMVPGAIGTQTGGSTIRPAAFCGVVGFKPTHGLIPRTGMLQTSRTLDHVGTFARSVEDVALLTEVMVGFDSEDPDTRPLARGPYVKVATSEPPLPPRLAFVRTAAWKNVEPVMSEAFDELIAVLGERAITVDLGPSFEKTLDFHRIVVDVEMAHYLHRDYEEAGDKLSPVLRGTIERGRIVPAVEYMRAISAITTLNEVLGEVFNEYDALLTPSAPGPAPLGLETTGSSVFCTTWSYLGTPSITLPLMASEEGMPMGVQLVGRRDNDARLLRTANWLVKTLGHGGKSARPSRARKGKS